MTASIDAVRRLETTCLVDALLRAGADVASAEDCTQDAWARGLLRSDQSSCRRSRFGVGPGATRRCWQEVDRMVAFFFV